MSNSRYSMASTGVESLLAAEASYDWTPYDRHVERGSDEKMPAVSRATSESDNALAYIVPESDGEKKVVPMIATASIATT